MPELLKNTTLDVVIAICTRERPKMLAALLESCKALVPVDGANLRFIIVESGPETLARQVVDDFANHRATAYHHEPRIGVVYARNCAVEAFIQQGGDWLAFLDDDEVVDQGWLAAMVQAIADFPAYKVFSGHSIMIEPDNAPLIYKARQSQYAAPPVAGDRRAVTTQNVMFRRDVFAPDGLAKRFDLRFNTIGGSDFFLTFQLTDAGEKIWFVPDAVTRELILPERATFRFRTRKKIAQAHHLGLMSLLRFGRVRGHLYNILAALRALQRSLFFAITGCVVLVFHEQRGLKYFTGTVHHFCVFLGRPQIMWRQPVDLYKEVQGS